MLRQLLAAAVLHEVPRACNGLMRLAARARARLVPQLLGLSARAEDDVVASETFSTLMGDDVAPRRAFIEKNALDVKNLDI